MSGENRNQSTSQIEWTDKAPVPHFRCDGREYALLNDSIEVTIEGVRYRVKSVYSGSSFMGELLDALTMEKISRTVA